MGISPVPAVKSLMEKSGLTSSLTWANGMIWALIISIPVWLILGIILASML